MVKIKIIFYNIKIKKYTQVFVQDLFFQVLKISTFLHNLIINLNSCLIFSLSKYFPIYFTIVQFHLNFFTAELFLVEIIMHF